MFFYVNNRIHIEICQYVFKFLYYLYFRRKHAICYLLRIIAQLYWWTSIPWLSMDIRIRLSPFIVSLTDRCLRMSHLRSMTDPSRYVKHLMLSILQKRLLHLVLHSEKGAPCGRRQLLSFQRIERFTIFVIVAFEPLIIHHSKPLKYHCFKGFCFEYFEYEFSGPSLKFQRFQGFSFGGNFYPAFVL